MKIAYQCLGCSVRQIENLLDRMSLEDEKKVDIMRQVMSLLSRTGNHESPPLVAKKFYSLLREITGIADPYSEIKRKSNDTMLRLFPAIRDRVRHSSDPLGAAIRVSIAGNIIDYGARSGVTEQDIESSIHDALAADLPDSFMKSFGTEVSSAQRIVFIGDNAGEIVMDKILLENLPADITVYVVRGGPIINDVTLDDARYAGITDMVKVMTTGDALPGVDLENSPAELLRVVGEADVVISKGQGNLETMLDEPLERYLKKGASVYFLFKVKCNYVADKIRMPLGSAAFLRRTIGTG